MCITMKYKIGNIRFLQVLAVISTFVIPYTGTAEPNTSGKLNIWFRNETALLVLWQPPYPVRIFTHYKVSIEPPDAIENVLNVEKGNEPPGPAQAAFKGLVSGRAYNITVQTVSEDEISLLATAQYRTVPPRPMNLIVDKDSITSNSFRVLWEAPKGVFEFDNYQVSLENSPPSTVQRTNESVASFDFRDIPEPGKTLNVVVKTASGKLKSWPAASDVTLRPLPVHNLRYFNGDAMKIIWDPDPTSTQDKYRIVYHELDALNGDASNFTTDFTYFNMDRLLNGRSYLFSVQALSKTMESNETSIYVLTRPSNKNEELHSRSGTTETRTALTDTVVTPIRPPTPTSTTKTTTQNGCALPTESELIVTDIFQRTIELGSVVPPNAIVKFACQRGYTSIGILTNYCMNNEWNHPLPICQKFCSTTSLRAGLSTIVACESNGGLIKCTDTVPPKTVARISCAIGFMSETETETRLRCESHGHWNYARMKCRMQCGRVAPPTTKFSRGGHAISIVEVPWHVGIYSNFDGTFKHLCGGTIISPRLVISAAHCFWSETSLRLHDKKYYKIVAGKYYRDYEKEKELYQVSALEDIILEPPYNDRARNYRNDIAVLRLVTALKFSALVSPVCIRFEKNARKEVATGTIGKFAGWGITENLTAAEELQCVTMTAISNIDCQKQLQQYGNYELPDDKFCLKDEFGKSACRGDSGGGYVKTETNAGTVTHYLIGVISHAPAKEQDCAVDGVVALTNVNYFERLIENAKDEETEDF